jgi:iron-sulfur cluster repair protein YtfE (RIC family)
MPKSKSSNNSALPLALEILEADHRKVEDLFETYEAQKDDDDETRQETAERICGELTVHMAMEEEIFYPWLRDNLEEDDMELVNEAEVEHNGAKELMNQIETAEEVDEMYDAKVKVLSEYIKHHVKEEEQEVFPSIRGKTEELDSLGQEMASRKAELTEELGLADEAVSPASAPRDTPRDQRAR